MQSIPRTSKHLIVFATLLAGAIVAPGEERFASGNSGARTGAATPNVELPASVVAPAGQLTLFADYKSRAGDRVSLYLVNRTREPVSLPAQSGDPFIKLEKASENGSWERAQAHQSSWCGNSYADISLPPGQHFAFSGYLPTSGMPAKVRFASYLGTKLVSNEGEGFYLPGDVEDARRDSLNEAISRVIGDFLEVDGSYPMPNQDTPQRRVAALRLAQAAGDNAAVRAAAARLAERWEKAPKASEDQKEGAKAIRKILAEAWPAGPDSRALFNLCMNAAMNPGGRPKQFGQPESEPYVVWRILGELAYKSTDPEPWKPVVSYAIAHPENFSDSFELLRVGWLADELVLDSFFENNLTNLDVKVQTFCAETLARRGKFERLARLGRDLSPVSQIIVLYALSDAVRPTAVLAFPRQLGDEEEQFWANCFKTQPYAAAAAIPPNSAPHCNSHLLEPLRDILSAEVARSAKARDDYDLEAEGQKLRMVVRLLDACQSSRDTGLFRELLKHRGYEDAGISGNASKRYFCIREVARDALVARKQNVPENLVLFADSPSR